MLDLSIVSTNKISLNKAELASMPKTKGVVGKDVRYTVGFIPWSGVPHLDEAVKDALEKGSGDLMTDVSVYTKSTIWFLFIASIIANSIEVEGTVVKTNNN